MVNIRMSIINSDVELVVFEFSLEDSVNDSFICLEFEYENEKNKNEFDFNVMIFSKVLEVDNEYEDFGYLNRIFQFDGLDLNGGSFVSTVGFFEEGFYVEYKLFNGYFVWDYLMNWGLSYEKFVGVFKDIVLLFDGEISENQGDFVVVDCEEYV